MRRAKIGLEFGGHIKHFWLLTLSRFAGIAAIALCIVIVILLNSHATVTVVVRQALMEVNSRIVRVLGLPMEVVHNVREYMDEQLHLAEVRRLKEQNRFLQESVMLLTAEGEELQHLRKLLNVSLSPNYKLVTTRLLRASIDVGGQSFMIPVGSDNDINLSTFVVDGVGLIGKVVDVGYDSARVRLVTSVHSKTPVIFGQSRERAILAGDSVGEKRLRIVYCSNLSNVKTGELAITSGDGSLYPYGIGVGTVVRQDGEVFVKSMFDIQAIEFVKAYTKKQLEAE